MHEFNLQMKTERYSVYKQDLNSNICDSENLSIAVLHIYPMTKPVLFSSEKT